MRNGTRNGLQLFLCRDCGRQFNERSGTLFAGMKYKAEEVVLTFRLRFNYRLSGREVSELMAELGHPISKNMVLFWRTGSTPSSRGSSAGTGPSTSRCGTSTSFTSGSGARRATSTSWRTTGGTS
jgi:hypothetical protein